MGLSESNPFYTAAGVSLYSTPWASGLLMDANLGSVALHVVEDTAPEAILEALDEACRCVRESGGNACVGIEVIIDPFDGCGWSVYITGIKAILSHH